jgi:predicted DNA-binding protein (MmcQ/YjbR family)
MRLHLLGKYYQESASGKIQCSDLNRHIGWPIRNLVNSNMTMEDLRNICLALPDATEDIKYGTDLCFSIHGKIFCGTRIKGDFRTGIKCEESDYADLIEKDGIVPMPRLSVTFWIRIQKCNALRKSEWKHYIRKSYELVVAGSLPKTKKR